MCKQLLLLVFRSLFSHNFNLTPSKLEASFDLLKSLVEHLVDGGRSNHPDTLESTCIGCQLLFDIQRVPAWQLRGVRRRLRKTHNSLKVVES